MLGSTVSSPPYRQGIWYGNLCDESIASHLRRYASTCAESYHSPYCCRTTKASTPSCTGTTCSQGGDSHSSPGIPWRLLGQIFQRFEASLHWMCEWVRARADQSASSQI